LWVHRDIWLKHFFFGNPKTKYKRSKNVFSVMCIALICKKIWTRLLQLFVQSVIGSLGTLPGSSYMFWIRLHADDRKITQIKKYLGSEWSGLWVHRDSWLRAQMCPILETSTNAQFFCIFICIAFTYVHMFTTSCVTFDRESLYPRSKFSFLGGHQKLPHEKRDIWNNTKIF